MNHKKSPVVSTYGKIDMPFSLLPWLKWSDGHLKTALHVYVLFVKTK